MDKFGYLSDQLVELEGAGLLRSLKCVKGVEGPVVRLEDGEKVLFCNNNYLNLAGDSRMIEAGKEALEAYGCGAGASRLISGTMEVHLELERQMAGFFRKEAALYFSSGWTANDAVLRTIPQEGDVVLSDKMNHASIIDGVRRGGAEFRVYRRGNQERLERLLADGKYKRKFIVTESVFSMDGDTADLRGLVALKNKYDAILIIDEAHSAGCMGETGAGLAERMGVLGDVDIIVAPMGKAFGASGAIVASGKTVCDYLVNKARSFIYTTAPSPVNCAVLLASLEIVRSEPQRREKLAANSEYMRKKLNDAGMNTGDSSAYIIPVIIGGAEEAAGVSKELYERGYFVAAVREPTVAAGTARLRVSVQSEHTKEQMDGLCGALREIMR